MSKRLILKTIIDLCMVLALLFLMTYNLLEDAFHEWIGTAMLILFVLHHILNLKWSRSVFRGRYTLYRIVQTIIAVAILFTMLGSMVSGIVLSHYVFDFLDISSNYSFSQMVHLFCAYWNLLLLSMHLGLHWKDMMGRAAKLFGRLPNQCTWLLRLVGILIAGYGVFAFIRLDIGSYMTMQAHFIFLDYDRPFIFYLIDYSAIMGLFILIGHYLSSAIRKHEMVQKR